MSSRSKIGHSLPLCSGHFWCVAVLVSGHVLTKNKPSQKRGGKKWMGGKLAAATRHKTGFSSPLRDANGTRTGKGPRLECVIIGRRSKIPLLDRGSCFLSLSLVDFSRHDRHACWARRLYAQKVSIAVRERIAFSSSLSLCLFLSW